MVTDDETGSLTTTPDRLGAGIVQPEPGWRFRAAEETARDVLAQLAAESRTELAAGLGPGLERELVARRAATRPR